MFDAFSQLSSFQQGFWYIAIPVSVIFVIQAIMTFAGFDSHDAASADFDGDLSNGDTPFQLFSLRNLTNFLLGFSWSGIAFYSSISNKAILIIVCTLVGSAMLFLFFLIIKQIMKLSENAAMKMNETIGKTANVYLRIPANNSGKGKIHISIKGSLHELDAITYNEQIETSSNVKIIEVTGDNTLVVEKL